MCGIMGYIGDQPVKDILLRGLQKLESRGYESAGIAIMNGNEVRCEKAATGVDSLADLSRKVTNMDIPGNLGIAHTRWPTHGGISEANAHPHCCCQQKIWVVHNGTLENFLSLRKELLKRGHTLRSETDSELIAHLIEENLSGNNFETAVQKALALLQGAFALAIINKDEPNKLIAACLTSPLLIGKIKKGDKIEYILASDYIAIYEHTNHVYELRNNEIAIISDEGCAYKTFCGESIEKSAITIDTEQGIADKGSFPYFMLKEIFEQPETVVNAFRGRLIPSQGMVKLGGLEKNQSAIRRLQKIDRVIIVACGTAYYAGLLGARYLNSIGLSTEAHLASEFVSSKIAYNPKKTMVLAISQSGETFDTKEAIREAKQRGALTVGIVNRVGSSLTRLDDSGIYNRAGFEIAVASTKAFISQVTVLALLLLYFGRSRFGMTVAEGQKIIRELQSIPEKIQRLLAKTQEIKTLAERFSYYRNFLFLGRGFSYPVALEGALKLKEISYIHAEGYAAGEMKHGPIALIDENVPVVIVAPNDNTFSDTLSNLQEVKARQAPIILITNNDCDAPPDIENIVRVPNTIDCLSPLLTVVPLQLFAYYAAVHLGRNPDKPRNLAKSVTVK